MKSTSGRKGKIGFFGGTFDPIHYGHISMARDLAEIEGLEQVWFCPAQINPHKMDSKPVSVEHRLRMTALAIEDEPIFTLLNIEAKREGPSFTVDTIRELLSQESLRTNPREIYLILSDEALPGFFQWRSPEEIVKMVPLLIGSRWSDSQPPPKFEGSALINKAIAEGWRPTQPFNISSTDIRSRLRNQEDCTGLLPKKVLDYIYQNNLYC